MAERLDDAGFRGEEVLASGEGQTVAVVAAGGLALGDEVDLVPGLGEGLADGPAGGGVVVDAGEGALLLGVEGEGAELGGGGGTAEDFLGGRRAGQACEGVDCWW